MTDTWEYGDAAATTKGFPWPPAESDSILGSFGETWKSATFDPTAFFARMPKAGGTGAALLYYLVIGMLVAGASLFWQSATGLSELMGPEGARTGLDPVISFLLSPPILVLVLAVEAGITHLLLLIFGGPRHGFRTTVRVFCFAYSPMIFGFVPVLGTLVGTVWMVVLAIIGLRESHETDGWKAALAVLLPVVLLVGLFILFAIMVAMGAAMIGVGA